MTDTKTLALVAEVERLTDGLEKANAQAERFEREWYLRGDEVERLTECLRYEQHRAGRRGTHSMNCYKFGPEHYECAMRQVERLTRELAEAKQDAANYRALRDSKGSGDYAICVWTGEEWSAMGMPTRDIDARICEFAAMRRTDAGATSPTTQS